MTYPSSSPWGPHGPQVSVPSVTPNPTAPSPPPSFAAPEAYPASAPSTASGGSGGATMAAVGGTPAVASAPIGGWVRNLAIAGGVLGCLLAFGGSMTAHLLPSPMGVLRLGLAGAAAGAGIPPAVRAAALASRALIWIVVAGLLWGAALGLSGQTDWLARLR